MATQTPSPSLDPSVVDDLSSALRGWLFRPGEFGYDDARKVFNAMIDRRPDVIVRIQSTGAGPARHGTPLPRVFLIRRAKPAPSRNRNLGVGRGIGGN